MGKLFTKMNGTYYAMVNCPDCGMRHRVSYKNYYAQKSGKYGRSFRCDRCAKIKASKTRRNPNLRKTTHGYIKLYRPEDSMSDKRGEVYEHRLVMSQIIGRPLKKWETVHHKDGNKTNNSPKNLELHPNSEHLTITLMQKRIEFLERLLKKHNVPFP